MGEVGFQPEVTRDEYGRDVFVARRPSDPIEKEMPRVRRS